MMYIFLSFCTLLSFVYFQNRVRTGTYKKYFSYALVPIILYCITYGFRKGWGTDYDNYDSLFLGTFILDLDSYEPLFQLFIISLRQITDTSVLFFIIVSALTIGSYIYLLKDNRDVLGLGLSLFYLFSAYQASNLIRFFLALSIAYIGIDIALRKKWLIAIVVLLSSTLIHAGMALFIVIALFLLKFKVFLNLKLNIFLYIATAIISTKKIQALFGDLIYRGLSAFDFGNLQLVKYADKDIVNSYILGTTWEIDNSLFYIIFSFLHGFLFVILGYRLIKKMPQIKNIEFYYQIGI